MLKKKVMILAQRLLKEYLKNGSGHSKYPAGNNFTNIQKKI
jgi:hypothetical protein